MHYGNGSYTKAKGGSAAIPGTLLGLVIVHQKYGLLPLQIVMEPAIHLAREGSVLNKKQAFIFTLLEPIFSHSEEGKKLFHFKTLKH